MWRVTSDYDRSCRAAAGAACRAWRPRGGGAAPAGPDPARPVGGAGGGGRGPGEVLPEGLLAWSGAVCVLPRRAGLGRAWAVPGRHPPGGSRPASLVVPAHVYGYVLSRG